MRMIVLQDLERVPILGISARLPKILGLEIVIARFLQGICKKKGVASPVFGGIIIFALH